MCMPCMFGCPQRPEKSVRSPGVGVWGSCKLPEMGAGNQAWVLSESSKCFQAQSHLSSSWLPFFNAIIHLNQQLHNEFAMINGVTISNIRQIKYANYFYNHCFFKLFILNINKANQILYIIRQSAVGFYLPVINGKKYASVDFIYIPCTLFVAFGLTLIN